MIRSSAFLIKNLIAYRLVKIPLSAEEISKRYESTCKSIQDPILVMESCLGRDSKYNFDFAKVIGNLQEVNTLAEDRAVSMMIHAL